MKQKIFMSPESAEVCIGTPLFQYLFTESIDGSQYTISPGDTEAWIIDYGECKQILFDDTVREMFIEICEL